MPRRQLLLNQAQTLEHHIARGRPDSAPTLTVYRYGTTQLTPPASQSWPQSMTLDPVDTTVELAADAGSEVIRLASVANLRTRRRYFVVALGDLFEVEVKRVDPTTRDVTLDQPLRETIPAGALFVGHRVTYTFDAAQLATRDRDLRAELSYTVDGEAYVETLYFDIVRELLRVSITEADLTGAGINTYIPGMDLEKIMASAHDEMLDAIEQAGRMPDLVKSKAGLVRPLVYKTGELIGAHNRDYESAAFYEARFESAMSKYNNNKLNWYDVDDDQVHDGRVGEIGHPGSGVGLHQSADGWTRVHADGTSTRVEGAGESLPPLRFRVG